jgi:hypothetical protein
VTFVKLGRLETTSWQSADLFDQRTPLGGTGAGLRVVTAPGHGNYRRRLSSSSLWD